MTKIQFNIEGTYSEWIKYDSENREEKYTTITLPTGSTNPKTAIGQKNRFIIDAFEWVLKYDWEPAGTTTKSRKDFIGFRFGTARYKIWNNRGRVILCLKKLIRLPKELFVGITFYDFLTGIERFNYTQTIKNVKIDGFKEAA